MWHNTGKILPDYDTPVLAGWSWQNSILLDPMVMTMDENECWWEYLPNYREEDPTHWREIPKTFPETGIPVNDDFVLAADLEILRYENGKWLNRNREEFDAPAHWAYIDLEV